MIQAARCDGYHPRQFKYVEVKAVTRDRAPFQLAQFAEPASLRPPLRPEHQLMPTLFDRLRDDAPGQQVESADVYAVNRTRMREIIERDLGYLLNTTNREHEVARERYPAVASSTLNYGVPPIAGGHVSDRKWADIVGIIKRAIEDFEPRLIPDSLLIAPLSEGVAHQTHNLLHFEISGMVHMIPYPVAFTSQSSLDLESCTFSLKTSHAS